jgi:hypothetical protein
VRVGSLTPKQVAVHTFAWKRWLAKRISSPWIFLNLIGIVSNLKLVIRTHGQVKRTKGQFQSRSADIYYEVR